MYQPGDVVRIGDLEAVVISVFPDLQRAAVRFSGKKRIRMGHAQRTTFKFDELEFVRHGAKVCERCGATNGKHKRPCNLKTPSSNRGDKTARFKIWERRERKGQ